MSIEQAKKSLDKVIDKVLYLLAEEMKVEFPATDSTEFNEFYNQRGYNQIADNFWFGNIL